MTITAQPVRAQHTISNHDLPKVTTLNEARNRVKSIHTSVFAVRVKQHTSRYLITPGSGTFYGAATTVLLPGQEDEPPLLLTASQLVHNVASVEIQHPDLSWHPASIVHSDVHFGLALLNAPLPDSPALPVSPGDALSTTLSIPAWEPPSRPALYPARIGSSGSGHLSFYRELDTARPLLGAPVIDQNNRIVAIVGLLVTKDNSWWAISGRPIPVFLQSFVNPTSAKPKVTREPLELRNPFRPRP